MTTTPYQQNDYQSSSTFRPYRLPVNDIFKGLVAQDQFWKEGARRVKSAYDNALGLELTKEQNKTIRDEYMKEAEKQLSKLSTMDLSNVDVQKQGVNLFKPLFEDEGIISDNAATKHINKVNSDAMAARNSEGGKFYSNTNHQYALTGADDFRNSTDRMAGKEYLKRAKTYEPFYDPGSELTAIMKNCKPDKASGEGINGMYIKHYSDESLSALKINSCLDAGLSEKAKRQLQINGAVTYRNNPEALRDKYIPHIQGTRSALATQKAALSAILTNKDNLKSMKKEDLAKLGISDASMITPDYIKRLEENMINIDTRIANLDETIGKLNTGDFSPVTGDNYEPVASTVYSRDYMQNVGEGFSYNFQTNSIKADPVQMMYYKEYQTNLRQEDDQRFEREQLILKNENDLKLKLLEARKKGDPSALTGEDWQNAAVNLPTGSLSAISEGDSYEKVTARRVEISNKLKEVNAWATSRARAFGMPDDIADLSTPQGKQWFETFKASAGQDPTKQQFVKDFEERQSHLVVMDDILKGTQDMVEQQVAPDESNLQTKIFGMPGATFNVDGKNVTVSSQEIYDALSGKGGRLKIVAGSTGVNVPGGTAQGPSGGGGYTPTQYYLDGKLIQSTYGSEGNTLHAAVRNIQAALGEGVTKIKKKRNDLMQSETVLQTQGYLIPELNDKESPFKARLLQQAGLTESSANKISVGATDGNGNVLITVAKPEKDEYDYDLVMNSLMQYGAGNNARYNEAGQKDPKGNVIKLTGVTALDKIDENRMSQMITPYVRIMERKATLNNPASTSYIRASNGNNYRMSVIPSPSGGYTYDIIDQRAPRAPISSFSNRIDALKFFEGVLGPNQVQVATR